MLVLSFSVEEFLAPLQVIFQIFDNCHQVHGPHFHATFYAQLMSDAGSKEKQGTIYSANICFWPRHPSKHSPYSCVFGLIEMSRHIPETCYLIDNIQNWELADSQR